MKTRIKFSKMGSMRFIGHLDLMRYFQKAFRRAGIPVAYSQGFSPHQLMSFTSPLGLGLTSEGEYLDVELQEEVSRQDMLSKINAQMNDEIKVLDFVQLADDAKPSMAVFAAADYVIYEKEHNIQSWDRQDFEKDFSQFLSQKEIVVSKKTKKSEKQIDIRPFIYEYGFSLEEWQKIVPEQISCPLPENEDGGFRPLCYLRLTAGSVMNIKPELVLEAFLHSRNMVFNPYEYHIHRLEMYADEGAPKGKVRTKSDEEPCQLVPLSVYGKRE